MNTKTECQQTTEQRLRAENKRLKAALRGLLPRGWRDGTMDHMPGIKAAREALGLGPKCDPVSEPYRGPLESNPLIPSWCKDE